jgi:hypothetical protein
MQIDAQRPEAYYNLGLLYQDYMGGQEAQLNQAVSFYRDFVQRATAERYAQTRENVSRECRRADQQRRRSGRGSRPQSEWVAGCTPGRIQQILRNLELQRELAEMQRQIEAQQRQQQQQQPAPAPEAPAPTPAAPPAQGQPAPQ